MTPYYVDADVTLYLGDCRDVLRDVAVSADCVIADPPYEATRYEWDEWPAGWPGAIANLTGIRSMWVFGSLKMYLDRWHEFTGYWKYGHDIVWDKLQSASSRNDRFAPTHEQALHLYRGAWGRIRHEVPREGLATRVREVVKAKAGHFRNPGNYVTTVDGTVLMRSVIRARSMRGRGRGKTEKSPGILDPMIRYACPPGGIVLDPFAGSGSTADVARTLGRRTILIEADEAQCAEIRNRMEQGYLLTEGVTP